MSTEYKDMENFKQELEIGIAKSIYKLYDKHERVTEIVDSFNKDNSDIFIIIRKNIIGILNILDLENIIDLSSGL